MLDELTILNELEISQIHVFDITGNLLKSTTNEVISVQELAAGTYTISVITEQGAAMKRFEKK